jgi:hypothetical protein
MKCLIALILMMSFAANANECAQDEKKYCQGVDPGQGQIARCLSDYEANLTPACAKKLKVFKAEANKKNPCFEDLSEYCADIPSDPLNYEFCLIKNESRLNAKCSADFKAKKGRIITRNVCAQDIANTCYKEISGPEGSVNRCLFKNKTKLSGFCQKNVDKKIADLRAGNPCFDETEKYCPTQISFIDIQDCLAKKVATLTPQCKPLVANELDKMKANPCYRDLRTHCRPGLSPSDQHHCLSINDNVISNACKQFRATEENKANKMVDLCEQDRLKLCKDAPFKDGAVVKCLRLNKAKVSAGCQKFL